MLKWPGHELNLDQRTHVMGILNVTPDSFSDGGRYNETGKAVEHALQMVRDGADIIDVGGESTRPYADKVPASEEIDRVIPVIEALKKELTIPISIDTCKADVAEKALKAGASMINDISAFRIDPRLASIAGAAGVPVILMHMKGRPENMQENPVYEDLFPEILEFFINAVKRAVKAGIKKELIIVDPGIGFGKTFDDNLKILKGISRFTSIKQPILIGTSNKAFIGHILDKNPDDRDTGTMATIACGVMGGAAIVRVHNVKMAVETVTMVDAIRRGSVKPDTIMNYKL